MVDHTNPAQDLSSIFQKVAQFGDHRNISPNVMSSYWVAALEIDRSEFYDSLAGIIKLVAEIERILDTNDVRNRDIHAKQLAAVKNLIFEMGSMQWPEFRRQVTDNFLMLLQLLDSELSDYWPKPPESIEGLATLQTQIEDLISDVVESDLGDEIKRVITDGLNAVRNAILEYRVRGVEGIRQALDMNIGLIARYFADLKTADESDDGGVISKWSGVLQRVDTMISLALNVPQLAAPVITQWMLTGAS